MTAAARWRPSRLVRATLALVLAVLGVVLLRAGLVGPAEPPSVNGAHGEHGLPSPTTTPAANRTPTTTPVPERTPTTASTPVQSGASEADVQDQITGVVLPESDPVSVAIPRIGVRSTLVDLGLDDEGAMEVPEDPALAGWFSRGAAPGALGPAVIAGHVTWDGAPAVFHRLGSVRRGDHVTVKREDGRTASFTVTRIAQFSKSRFPSEAVYGAIDHAGLRLITCGGTYDSARHRYLDNVVVFAKMDAVHGPRS
jgi:sortase (surface protein transpeptidase)